MPYRTKKTCEYPMCPELIYHGRYCEIHTDKPARKPDDRESSYKRGYNRNWQKYRVQHLRRDPWCVQCGSLADVVDHVTPVSLGGRFWDKLNHQSLCYTCHNRKTGRERNEIINVKGSV